MKIHNLDDLSLDEVNSALQHGAKFVVFPYCISILIMTFRRSSNIYFIKPGESTIRYSIFFTLVSFFLGWWGIPWGPIHTIGSIYRNLSGGKDITQEVISAFNQKE